MRDHVRQNILAAGCLMALGAGTLAAAQTPAAPAPAAQTPAAAETLPSASQIVDKYVEAIGGKAAWEKLTSRVSKGTFEIEQMPGEATEEIDAKAPDKQLTITDAPSFLVKRGYNGTAGWEDMPQTGLHDLTGGQLTAMKRYSDFYYPVKLDELYPKMAVKSKESVNGHSAYVVEAIPPEGGPEQFYFDADSGLLLRHVLEIDGPDGKVSFDSNFDDYRAVDGIKLPFLLHQSMGEFAWTIKLTDVKHNVPLDDSKFDKPAADAGSAAPQN